MVHIPTPEKKEYWLNVKVTPSLAGKVERAAELSGVTKSDLLRYIVEKFLAENYENLEATPPKNETNYEIFEVM